MRQLSEVELDRIKLLTENSVEITLIQPTATGLDKSIMDATDGPVIDATRPLRSFFREKSIHDYENQGKGPENKIQISSNFLLPKGITHSKASLYRPVTKNGDPRIWFSGLAKYADANDILGIFEIDKVLYVINITKLDLRSLIESNSNNPLKELVNVISQRSNSVAEELLGKLRAISATGFVPALLQADTSVGRTLESLLGIPMNSSKSPDYKGIELKSAKSKRTRNGLFAKTPDWKLSKFKNRAEILDAFGYWEDGIFRLYNTIRATGRNPQGLILRTDYALDYLIENSDRREIGDFLVWRLEVLQKALAAKHKETFWIEAESKTIDGNEYFLYKKVKHTKNPLVGQFGLLIDVGAITLDYSIKRLSNSSIDDRGCNFKIKPNSLRLLFPPSRNYSLL